MRKLFFTILAFPVVLAASELLPSSTEPQLPAESTEPNRAVDSTPLSLPGSEPMVFRRIGDTELRLHVVKPKGWSATDRRPCFVAFFGGGWISGSPVTSVNWARWAAALGFVGIAPDYRTRQRFKAQPEDCVADGRAALHWIVDHAAELGIDPARLVVQGGSAGGHVAAWTAIPKPGPGPEDPAPTTLPTALILLNPVSDTTARGYAGPKRFGNNEARALACSVPHQMPSHMPPTIIFHGTIDKTVPYANSVALRDQLLASGNVCELITFEGLGHSYNSSQYGEVGKAADEKTKQTVIRFLTQLQLLPVNPGGHSLPP